MKGLSPEEREKLIPEGTILYGYRGSIAHGMYVPSTDPNSIDDKDTIGIRIMPLEYYFGLKNPDRAYEVKYNEWDSVVYDIKKYFRLLLKSNPNVMSLLWVDPKYYIIKSDDGQIIINNRHLFASRQVYFSFSGYAKSQFHKMEHCKCLGYMGEKRKKLVEKFGFDCKNAAHLIRILRMGIEFLKDGEFYIERHDASELLDIKKGKYTLDEVKKEAESLFKLASESFIRSDLPKEPDYEGANKLLIDILDKHFWRSL